MRSYAITSAVLLLVAASTGNAFEQEFLRGLQPSNPPPPPQNGTAGNQTNRPPPPREIPKVYGENITIPFDGALGCGACIRGGYIYCIPGAEGSDPSTWGTKKSVCCKNATTCTSYTAANSGFNCSSKYTDKMMAKAMCPFRKAQCGNSSTFGFDKVGDQQNITIKLQQGETCTYQVQTKCGLPAF